MSAIALQALADETGGQLVGESVALQNSSNRQSRGEGR